MGRFAWRNLLTRPLRTTLALIGLSIPILGVLGLFSVSEGMRNMVGDTLNKIQGVMVLRENTPTPVFSDLPADMVGTLRKVPGVRVVAPEILKIAPSIEGRSMMGRVLGGIGRSSEQRFASLIDQPIIQGQDIAAHAHLRSAIFSTHMLPKDQGGGRFLNLSDRGKRHIVISKKIARDYGDTAAKRPKRVGETLDIAGKAFTIVGIYDTKSMVLDVTIIMDIDTARELLGISKNTVSSFYVESVDPTKIDQVATVIRAKVPNVDARSMADFISIFGKLMGHLDTFLMMTVSLALLVGVVGIINTMLMSTTERFGEFGVLRTNGWSRANVLTLVTTESAYLGLLAGLIGCALAWGGTVLANQFIGEGLQLSITGWLFALGLGLSIVMGTIGGLYPAWRAARLVPMDAIRIGSR